MMLFPNQRPTVRARILLEVGLAGNPVSLKQLFPEEWERIRKMVYRNSGYHCEACGGQGSEWPVACQPVWTHDEQALIQRLVKFVALCPTCLDIWQWRINSSSASRYNQLCQTNGWTKEQAVAYVNDRLQARAAMKEKNWAVHLVVLALDYQVDIEKVKKVMQSEASDDPEDFDLWR